MSIFWVDLDYPVPECLKFWILLALRMIKVVVATAAVRYAKLQSNRYTNKPTPHCKLILNN